MPATRQQHACHTQRLIDQLDPAVRFSMNRALAASWVQTKELMEVFDRHGLVARAENVNRHRRRLTGTGNYACKCPLPDGASA